MANVGEEKALWLRLHALANRGEWVRNFSGNEFSLVVSPIFSCLQFHFNISKAFSKTMIVSCLGHRGKSRRVQKKGKQHRRISKGREKWRREAKSSKEKIRKNQVEEKSRGKSTRSGDKSGLDQSKGRIGGKVTKSKKGSRANKNRERGMIEHKIKCKEGSLAPWCTSKTSFLNLRVL